MKLQSVVGVVGVVGIATQQQCSGSHDHEPMQLEVRRTNALLVLVRNTVLANSALALSPPSPA
jgi:hypothetical protein